MTEKSLDLSKGLEDPKQVASKFSKNEEPDKEMISILDLMKYSTTADYIYILIGFLGSTITGFAWPSLTILFGFVVDVFVEFEVAHDNSTVGGDEAQQLVHDFMMRIYLLSGMMLVVMATFIAGNYANIHCFQMFALRQMNEIKRRYFASILKQEVAWYDRQSSGEFASRISSDFKKFESGINENLGLLIYNISGCIVNLVVGLVFGWKLSLVIIAMAPIIGVSSYIMTRLQSRYTQQELKSYSVASSVAEEAISAIRTVFAFGGQDKERVRYEKMLKPALSAGCKRNVVTAIGNSVNWGTLYASFALGIWYGVKLIIDEPDHYSIGVVVIVFWAITGTGYNIGYAAPYYESFQIGRTAAAGIYKVIARQSMIDSSIEEGERLEDNFKTDIELRNVHFSYPTRSDVPILNGVNLKIKEGETVALVGASGCGKSTIIQLMQRFYDPNAGEVLLDGRNLKQLNPGWLRQQIGVVGQEPVLFDASIEENIRLGSAHMEAVSQADVERAAKEANAHEFISGLPEGYRTYVGDRGTQLSGGQKQRIAIARALISRPRVLLLDEATSALDLQSEHVVQAALDRASQGRTTIIVAHRLSTIINAHRIIVMDAGKVLEVGTHNELMARQSAYYNLVKAQEVTDTSNSNLEKQPKLDHLLEHNLTDTKLQRSKSKTLSMDDSETDSESESELKSLPSPSLRLLRLIWQDKVPFLIAFTCSIVYGMHTPIYALIFGGFVDSLTTSSDPAFLHSQGMFYGLLFVAQAGAVFLVNVFQISLFGLVGERLTMRLRMMAFGAIMKQEVAWFDKPENSAGALCSRLADDAANIQGATGLRVALMCQIVSGLICAVAIGFFFNWRMALMSLALMPIIAFASIVSNRLSSDQAEDDTKTAKLSSKILIEVINAMRTVVSMHKQQYFFGRFAQSVDRHYLTRKAKVMKKSLLLASTLAAPFFAYAGSFCYGGYLLANNYLNSGDFFRIAECCIISALIIGETAILSADYNKAKMAAYNIFKLIDQSPEKKAFAVVEATATAGRSQGNVSVRGLQFHYPSRPETAVLSGLSFSAQKGQTVALVGASGCGKSTTIQLLEQFYDYSGEISLDGKDIAKLDVDWVRRQLALVQQEPILFSYSIRENIAYGDNSREVPFEEIVKAAQMANVHEFVAKLPQGYETPVGGKGAQLSGGQKQRIAIARSLVRDPPVLLLDEATSALDTASEKVVQAALDEAAKGRTCLVIAHRLKTIVNAHKIVVLDGGRNVEEGTHEELLARKGHYWRLYNSAIAS